MNNTTNTNNEVIKQFWQEAGQSMMGNFYRRYNIFERPIDDWNKHIKALTTGPEDLQETIQDYLTLFAIDVLRRQCTYTIGILGSNLKRWHLLHQGNGNIVFFLVELHQTLTKGAVAVAAAGGEDDDLRRLFSGVELFLLNINTARHWAALVDYVIAHRKQGALEKLRTFFEQNVLLFDIYVHIEATYGVKLWEGMSAKKILGLIPALK